MILIRNLCFEQLMHAIWYCLQNKTILTDQVCLFKWLLTLFFTTPLEHHLKIFLVPCAPPKQSKRYTNVAYHTFNCFNRQKGPLYIKLYFARQKKIKIKHSWNERMEFENVISVIHVDCFPIAKRLSFVF